MSVTQAASAGQPGGPGTADAPGCEHDVFFGRHMREEVEALENQTDALMDRLGIKAGHGDILTIQEDHAVIDRFEQIDAAKQCRFPGA